MSYDTAAEKVTNGFENFNIYAQRAQRPDNDDADIDATLALAFEVSQLRYLLRRFLDTKKGAADVRRS